MRPFVPPIFSIAVVVSASLDWTPGAYLIATWPDRTERIPVKTPEICNAAIDAVLSGWWLADDPPLRLRCEAAR